MNEKEIAEIRRRFRPDKNNITHVRGCYVNEKREIVSEFDPSLALMSQEESEKFLAILKRTLSGTPGKHLIDLSFTTQQVVDSDEHRLLMALRGSGLKDEAAVGEFFRRVIQGLALEGNYLILLAHDAYDVPYRSRDGETQADASSEVYSYILCSICPVKLTKPALSYHVHQPLQFRLLHPGHRGEPCGIRGRRVPQPGPHARRRPEGDFSVHPGGHPGRGQPV